MSVAVVICLAGCAPADGWEQRDAVSFLRGPYNLAYFYRHNDSFRYGAAFHYHHGKQHDVLLLTPLSEHTQVDQQFNGDVTAFLYAKTARTEPTMELYGPYFAQIGWRVYRAIDWTHMHHEQTYDILSARDIAWDEKADWTARAVRYYLEKNAVARSCAPLDVTMRRAGAMMKPYFALYRNYYPRSSDFAYVAHWWHPAIYEAMMIAGNDDDQNDVVDATNHTMLVDVLLHRPQRMLLSREMMPRYSRMSPESANIFDNLHMLHGLVYDLLAYEGWNDEQKRAELYRIVDAMSYRPGDELLARKFTTPHPDVDPRVYAPWMAGYAGDMNRIMEEMMREMMPMMMPQGMSAEEEARMWQQFRMKLSLGLEPGEIPGSLHDALMAVMPNMQMMPGAVEPGESSPMMTDAMLNGWRAKYGALPDIAPWPMDRDPAPPLLAPTPQAIAGAP
jgi:hypothetical protein